MKFNLTDYIYIFCIFLFSLGSFILNPYFAVYISDNLSYGIVFTGLLISIKVISQKSCSIVGGILTDLFDSNMIAQIGIIIKIISFLLLALCITKSTLILSSILNGIGSSLFNPSIRKILFLPYSSNDNKLKEIIAYRNIAFNLGASIGPLIGILLVFQNFKMLCIFIAIIYFLLSIILIIIKRKDNIQKIQFNIKYFIDLIKILKYKEIFPLYILQFTFFYFYSNVEYLLPLFIAQEYNNYYITLFFIINTICVILMQFIVSKGLIKLENNKFVFIYYLIFFILLYFLSLHLVKNQIFIFITFIIITIFFSLAEVILSVAVDLIATKQGNIYNSAGTIFGAISLIASVAIVIANYINGHIMNAFNFKIVWILNIILSITSCLVLQVNLNIKSNLK